MPEATTRTSLESSSEPITTSRVAPQSLSVHPNRIRIRRRSIARVRRTRNIDGLATVASATEKSPPLAPFSDEVRRWFDASFEAPTPAQERGWPAIASGANTLICAPTGSGKTLAAFLWGIDRLAARSPSGWARVSGSSTSRR